MSTKTFVNYKSALNSFSVANERFLGLFEPGRVRGFDSIVIPNPGLIFDLIHDTTGIKKVGLDGSTESDFTGVAYTKQGTIAHFETAVENLAVNANADLTNERIDVIVFQHSYQESTSPSLGTVVIVEGTPGGGEPALPSVSMIKLGTITMPPDTDELQTSYYTPAQVLGVGGNPFFNAATSAFRNEDNTFQGLNNSPFHNSLSVVDINFSDGVNPVSLRGIEIDANSLRGNNIRITAANIAAMSKDIGGITVNQMAFIDIIPLGKIKDGQILNLLFEDAANLSFDQEDAIDTAHKTAMQGRLQSPVNPSTVDETISVRNGSVISLIYNGGEDTWVLKHHASLDVQALGFVDNQAIWRDIPAGSLAFRMNPTETNLANTLFRVQESLKTLSNELTGAQNAQGTTGDADFATGDVVFASHSVSNNNQMSSSRFMVVWSGTIKQKDVDISTVVDIRQNGGLVKRINFGANYNVETTNGDLLYYTAHAVVSVAPGDTDTIQLVMNPGGRQIYAYPSSYTIVRCF